MTADTVTPRSAPGEPEPPERARLAAVVFTDVVGYSARMQRDEAATIAGVQKDFAVMREACASQGGEVLNTMGDGMMLCFGSAVDAVNFSLKVQEAFSRRNAALGDGTGLEHRVGVHLGDVFRVAGGHVAGDGVNIAARLESKAPPGGVCISQAVYDTVRGKVAMRAEFMGPQVFKNIAEPVAIWHIAPDSGAALSDKAAPLPLARKPSLASRRALVGGGSVLLALVATGGAYWARRQPVPAAGDAGSQDNRAIAVLPFTNMSEDKDAAYFADGIHEDLLTQLALLGELKVVSRTSVMDYRNSRKNMRQIGQELGVGSLVEGSVRRAGNQVRVTAQLIDARTDKHVWASNYDRDLKDIFAVQSELATAIAGALRVSLSPPEQARLAARPTTNLEAYDLFMRHQELFNSSVGAVRGGSTAEARIALLDKAVALDPGFALAWARLAADHARGYGYGRDTSAARKAKAQAAMAKALALAGRDPQVKIEEGTFQLLAMADHARAQQAYDEVLGVAPNNISALVGLGEVHNQLYRTPEAVAVLERALAVDARHAGALARLSATYSRYRHFERALQLRRQLARVRPDDVDLEANYRLNEYWATGQWDAYDRWRATLPPGVEFKSARVRNTDADRALARRDFAEVHRLIDVQADDYKNVQPVAERLGVRLLHALAYLASGDRPRATAEAKAALPQVQAEIAKSAEEDGLYYLASTLHALLGQREAALAAHAREVELIARRGDKFATETGRHRIVGLSALLGERERALEQLRKQLAQPGAYIHDLRVSLELASLWDDPSFVAVVNDPASNAPLPLNLKL